LFVLYLLVEVFLSDTPDHLFHSESVLIFCVPIVVSAFVLFSWASFVTAGICAVAVAALTLPGRFSVPQFSIVIIVTYFAIAASAWIGSRTMVAVIRKAQSEASKFKTILSSAGDGIIVLDARGKISLVNPIVAFIMENPIGKSMDDFFGNTIDRETNDVLRNLTHPQGWTGMIKSGGRAYMVNAAPVAGRTPDAATVVTLRDITAEREVTATRNSLLRTVSHEMRTPVTVIEMSAEALLDGAFPDPVAQREVLVQIVNGARQLGGLIRDILDQARLDMGTIRPTFQMVDPVEILQTVVARFSGEARQVGLELMAFVGPSLPSVQADRDRLLQVLGNLVENAIKFTPQGTVTVRLCSGDDWWGYEVADTGIGISEVDQPEIWKPFHVVDRSMSRPDQHGGLGLGLAIVSGLARAMGGKIELESQIGRGSTFRLRLPLEVPHDQADSDRSGR
jgi:signal transduction histidine kinase